MIELLTVAMASGLAGFVDAVVGGGGLVLVPALLTTYPAAAPATLFGTNKGGAIWGTAWAAVQFARRVTLARVTMAWGMAGALVGSFFGAWVVTLVSAKPLKQALPFVLLAILVYTVAKKQLGRDHAPRLAGRVEALGRRPDRPGHRLLRRLLRPGHRQLLRVPVRARPGLRLPARLGRGQAPEHGHQLRRAGAVRLDRPHLVGRGAVLAVANVIGSLLGTRLALAKGAGFVRVVFIVVVSALIVKTAWDSWGPLVVTRIH